VLALAGFVYLLGLYLPDLMYGDAPQDAVMALRMYRDGDWTHLLKNGAPYLDKPHLLFWSAMGGYALLGEHDWAYRLPSVLVTALGAWSTFGLGRRLYGAHAGRIAAVIFVASHATILGNHDVRMDALLTGFVAFGLFQGVEWLETGRARAAILCGLGLGLAFDSKGLVALAIAGPPLALHLWARGAWARIASPAFLAAVAAFALALAPVLYAYHAQFGGEGIRFILLGQSVQRFTGGRGEVSAGDRLFFFHSLLWAFLPWSLLLYAAWLDRLRRLWRAARDGGLRALRAEEHVTLLGPIALLAALGFSRFKLPHYLNAFFPLLAVLVAGWLAGLARDGRTRWLSGLARAQWVAIGAVLAVALALNLWAFPIEEGWVVAAALPAAAALAWSLSLREPLQRIWVPSAFAILLGHALLSANYYPALSRFQPGSEAAARARALDVDWGELYFLDAIYQPFQLYTGTLVRKVDLDHVRARREEGRRVFLMVGERGRREVEAAGLPLQELLRAPDCRITVVSRKLLDPRTRPTACGNAYLVAIDPR
jgi:4-amino-4-deoxy-L-arabinose transferase-like glycosyltransferase